MKTATGRKNGWGVVRKTLYIVGVLVLWQIIVSAAGIKQFILPAPTTILSRIFVPSMAAKYHWLTHIGITSGEILISFILTAVVGIMTAMVIIWSSPLRKIITPIIIFFNSLPKIALAPLFLIWFGYGLLPNILIAILNAFFPVVINTAVGLEEIDDDLLDLARYLNASKFQVFTKIRIPNSLPFIFSGLKISATMCVVGSIVGEFIASENGLGFMLKEAQAFIDTPTMFASLFLISILGVALFACIAVTEKFLMPWAVKKEGVHD